MTTPATPDDDPIRDLARLQAHDLRERRQTANKRGLLICILLFVALVVVFKLANG